MLKGPVAPALTFVDGGVIAARAARIAWRPHACSDNYAAIMGACICMQ